MYDVSLSPRGRICEDLSVSVPTSILSLDFSFPRFHLLWAVLQQPLLTVHLPVLGMTVPAIPHTRETQLPHMPSCGPQLLAFLTLPGRDTSNH